MNYEDSLKWVWNRLEDNPIMPSHPLTSKKFPEGFGVKLKADDKAEFAAILLDPQRENLLDAVIVRFGVLLATFTDEEPFVRKYKGAPDSLHPNLSLPFHVDVVREKCLTDGYLKSEAWTGLHQGLIQDPTEKGRPLDTIITPTVGISSTMDLLKTELPEELRNYFKKSVSDLLHLRSKGTCKKTAQIQAWAMHCINTVRANRHSEFPLLEEINQAIFHKSPQVLRVSWDDPEVARTGQILLWDAGSMKKKSRPLVHGRDNRGNTLPEKSALFVF